jgi:hypothetical protein
VSWAKSDPFNEHQASVEAKNVDFQVITAIGVEQQSFVSGDTVASKKRFEHLGLSANQIEVVKQTRQKAVHGAIVLMTIAAWFIISNHCALGVVLSANNSASEHANCHQSQPAPEEKSGDEQLPCCKVLRATIGNGFDSIGINAQFWQEFPYTEHAILVSRDLLLASVPSTELDTGPPFAPSFVELILQRSLLSHAPPALV